MAITEVLVPQLSESVSEATLLNWKKQPGEAVTEDEILIEVETDKVVLEVPAPASGVLSEIVKGDGSTVTSGEVLARIDSAAKAAAPAVQAAAVAASTPQVAAPVPPVPSTPPVSSVASPAAAKILADKGVDPASVEGSGRGGRITKGDALQANPTATAAVKTVAAPVAPTTRSLDGRPEQRVPMSRLRARVAERLLQSQSENAILTTFNEVSMQGVIDLRSKYKEKFEKEHGVKLGFMSFFVKAVVAALKKYPVVNASVDGKDIIYHGYFDIGIAVGSPRGLVVPILRNADQMSVADIEKQIADFGARARDGKITLEDLTGGTFSISNGGVFGSMLSTPIINPPQAAILGVHATKDR
ncbi:MAG: 2-oxoglutarate dehydrogenase complex dihydrolipoyllysine-residue succinyltransferase, partial [Paralcaligenes sp.]